MMCLKTGTGAGTGLRETSHQSFVLLTHLSAQLVTYGRFELTNFHLERVATYPFRLIGHIGTPNGVRTRASALKGRRVSRFTMGAFLNFIIYYNIFLKNCQMFCRFSSSRFLNQTSRFQDRETAIGRTPATNSLHYPRHGDRTYLNPTLVLLLYSYSHGCFLIWYRPINKQRLGINLLVAIRLVASHATRIQYPLMVPKVGLEPTHPRIVAFETTASTNSTTRAY